MSKKCTTCPQYISNSEDYCFLCTNIIRLKLAEVEKECKSAIAQNEQLIAESEVYDIRWKQLVDDWKAETARRQQLEAQGRLLLQSGLCSDVVIQVDGQNIPAHKCILSAE